MKTLLIDLVIVLAVVGLGYVTGGVYLAVRAYRQRRRRELVRTIRAAVRTARRAARRD